MKYIRNIAFFIISISCFSDQAIAAFTDTSEIDDMPALVEDVSHHEAIITTSGLEKIEVGADKEYVLKEWFSAASIGNLNRIKELIDKVDINVAREADGQTALILAAFCNSEKVVKFLLSLPGININAQNNDGNTAFLEAVYHKHENIVRLFIPLIRNKRININARNKDGATALFCSVNRHFPENIQLIKLLLSIPEINVNARDKDGNTVLMHLAQNNSYNRDGLKETKELLNAGIDVNAQNNAGQTALMFAVKRTWYDRELFHLLLKIPNIKLHIKDNAGQTAINHASMSGPRFPAFGFAFYEQTSEYAKLIQNKITELTQQAFQAIKDNNSALLKATINQIGVDIADADGEKLLHKAIKRNNLDIVRAILLEDPAGLDKNNLDGKDAIEMAVGHPEILELIMNLIPLKRPCSNPACPNPKVECSLRCTKCKKVYYCCTDCQKADWNTHKLVCKQTQVKRKIQDETSI